MISLLARFLIKNPDNRSEYELRTAYGLLCGAVGIFLNILLFVLKFLAGLFSGSIAVTADAFNNLSDAGSSFVTILGFCLAGQKPDAGHPFGHGRFEYISGLAVSVLILLMGIELGRSSIDKIFHPAPIDASFWTLAALVLSIFIKLYMFLYNQRMGKRLNAPALRATALDSLSDCIATTVVLAATLCGRFWNLPLDGWCGICVAVFIFWSGFHAARDTLNPLLGTPPSHELVSQIRELVLSHKEIIGVHDLLVHDYGPGRMMISLHAEVPADQDVLTLHDEIDNIERELSDTLNCNTVIHMDPVVTDDGITDAVREKVTVLVHCIDDDIDIHDFRLVSGPTHTNIIFDAVVPYHFRISDRDVERKIKDAVRTLDGNYYAIVRVEKSYT